MHYICYNKEKNSSMIKVEKEESGSNQTHPLHSHEHECPHIHFNM